jgi:hypothetical protein
MCRVRGWLGVVIMTPAEIPAREKEHILLETRLTHLYWAEGLILLVAAIGVSLSLGGRFIASFVRDRMDGA